MPKKIMVVEDTHDLLQHVSDFLMMEGYEVEPCANGYEAYKKLATYKPDLIITDLVMPKVDGFALIEKIMHNQALKDIPVAIFSAKPPQENEAHALSLNVKAFIKKPCSLDDLHTAIKDILDH
ncbi:MAG TPA: response regulator [Ohtaekwangia sp.]|uniref:response regulator n=1 Tax=Ohtaekwangia sp. TaxID=2066019 RepID=UPI002F927584